MQTKIAFVLPICMVMYSRNFVKPHLSCYTFGSQAVNLNNLQTPDWCQSLKAHQQYYAGIPWSPVCQLIVVIDNFAWVISGAGGNMYIRQMNICGHINLLNTTNTQNVVYHSKSLNTYYLPHWKKSLGGKQIMICLFAETVTRRGPSWRESTALTAKLAAERR